MTKLRYPTDNMIGHSFDLFCFQPDKPLAVPEKTLNSGAVTATGWLAPGHHASISQDRSKGSGGPRNLLNILELVLDLGAVTTMVWTSQGHHASVC